ncbi:hypothetical protein ACFO5K_14650 [Nocardia halotolerans]|uniref:PPE domain-containing protein n=1 Tax=Nocardia halotolerans TaxID=1755878 RepID=A0ABV8VIA6_9NOCA
MRSLSGNPGTDPDYVSVVEVFDNLSHAEIHDAVRQLDPVALSNAGQLFLTAATGLGEEVDNAHGEIRAAIADGWRGEAAQAAAAAVHDFEQVGRGIADVLTAVGVRLAQAGDAAESVRTAVTEPTGARPDPAAALLDSEQAVHNATVSRETENARLDAVQAMETIYAGAFLPTGSGVPAFSGNPSDTGTVAAGTGAGPGALAGSAMGPVSATAPGGLVGTTVAAGASPVPAGKPVTANGVVGANVSAASGSAPSAGAVSPAVAPTGVVGADRTVQNSSAAKASAAPGSGTTGTPGTGGSASAVGAGRARRGSTGGDGPAPSTEPVATDAPVPTGADAREPTATSAAQATGAAGAGEESDGRQERDPVATGGEAATGMGAGAIGGLMGGAMAADAARAPAGPRPAAPPPVEEDEDDEFLRFLEDEPTYLEPADEVNPLIGKMEPTSPAVLGEWTERE